MLSLFLPDLFASRLLFGMDLHVPFLQVLLVFGLIHFFDVYSFVLV